MEHSSIFLWIFLSVIVFFLIRPIVLWYYKIYAIVANLEDIVKELKKLNDKIKEK
ncbi:MAG: hypothetical protein IH597_14840 [Bacteroidales bacterium]|nr:hypothetical protein [Bacteroidales bacterium]